MAKKLTDQGWEALAEALAVFYWWKADLASFLRGHLRDYPELLAPLDFVEASKRKTATTLVTAMRSDPGRYTDLAVGLLVALSEFDHNFPKLAREDDGTAKVAVAQAALADVHAVVSQHSEAVQARERAQAEIEAEASVAQLRRSHSAVLTDLRTEFFDLHTDSSATPQQRGIRFEEMLNRLFALFDLDPKASYRLQSEQIDGAFTFRTDDYLLEARWKREPSEPKELRDFEGKVREKAQNVLGLFVSVNGFTEGARSHRGSGTPLILMDGQDLMAVLEERVELPYLLQRKRRHAATTGSPWLPVSAAISE